MKPGYMKPGLYVIVDPNSMGMDDFVVPGDLLRVIDEYGLSTVVVKNGFRSYIVTDKWVQKGFLKLKDWGLQWESSYQ